MTPTQTQLPDAVSVAPPAEPTAPLRLSEAMRLGAMTTGQAVGSWEGSDAQGRHTVCGIGAAQLALGITVGHKDRHLLPLLEETPGPPCPSVGCDVDGLDNLAGRIIHLNDTHGWPREQTADWLADLGL